MCLSGILLQQPCLFVCLNSFMSKQKGGHNLSAEMWRKVSGTFPSVLRSSGNQKSGVTPSPTHLRVLHHLFPLVQALSSKRKGQFIQLLMLCTEVKLAILRRCYFNCLVCVIKHTL